MNTLFLCIVIFLIILAVFDLVVGVSNDAVNFLNSAIGAKVARFRTIVIIASIGVFAGASLSNGMLDVARHGIMTPEFFSFYDVMCIFMAVMLTDVLLLDVFNSLGMPTSTTVSMVFELLGGAFALALVKIMQGATDSAGHLLTLGDLINTEKAMSVIMGIFLSVAIAFVLGFITQWLARVIFTFFGGIAITSIAWFMLVGGLKGSTLMTPQLHAFVNDNTWLILGGGTLLMSLVMTVLSLIGLNVMKTVVLAGTFALAMAFAGNDLVNFVGVPLTGLDAYQDYMAHGNSDPHPHPLLGGGRYRDGACAGVLTQGAERGEDERRSEQAGRRRGDVRFVGRSTYARAFHYGMCQGCGKRCTGSCKPLD